MSIAKKKDVNALRRQLAKSRPISTAGVAINRTTEGASVRAIGRGRGGRGSGRDDMVWL